MPRFFADNQAVSEMQGLARDWLATTLMKSWGLGGWWSLIR